MSFFRNFFAKEKKDDKGVVDQSEEDSEIKTGDSKGTVELVKAEPNKKDDTEAEKNSKKKPEPPKEKKIKKKPMDELLETMNRLCLALEKQTEAIVSKEAIHEREEVGAESENAPLDPAITIRKSIVGMVPQPNVEQ